LAWIHKEVLARLGHPGNGNLPHIVRRSTHLRLRHHNHPGPLSQVDERQYVGRGRIVGEPTQSILVALQKDGLAVLSAELLRVRVLPLRHTGKGYRPEISLYGPLEVRFIEQLLDGRIGWVAVGEIMGAFQPATRLFCVG